ncbi:uncharacterized protein LOC117297795 [Asterias rubens]|uniref:uncharacterized protein LOC117297795 n=1 Tax=Asterias rubens TaxID=7604 RepID=UPI0014552243|nr:uncharacterized protein LOC117297795 [Asterias rubens]
MAAQSMTTLVQSAAPTPAMKRYGSHLLRAISGFLMVVTAQPTVYAEILTPEADRKEGGQVDMRCTATNLETDHIVAWRTEYPDLVLRWGEDTYQNVNGRFIFDTLVGVNTQTVVQDFTITNVLRADTDQYVCNVNDPMQSGGNTIVATSNVTLSVLYFPSASFPMCSPAGPITVDAWTELDMRCSSESSHGTVTMTINATIQTSRYTNWISVINDDSDTVVRTLDLTVDDADNGVAFECFISSMYFTGMQRTCQIGPYTVRNTITIPMTEPTTSSTSTSSTAGSTRPSTGNPFLTTENEVTSTSSIVSSPSSSGAAPSSTPLIVAFIVVVVLAVTFFVIIIILILRDVRKNRLIKRLISEKEPRVTQPDPYMELQPTEDRNRVYMEPITTDEETIPTQDTYYQPVEVDESPEDDYAQPDDLRDSEQRITHQVSVHVDPTPSSSRATDTDHTYFELVGKVDKESLEDDYLRPRPHDPKEQRHVDPTPSSPGKTDTHHTYFQPGKVDNESQEDDYAQPDDPKEQNINHQVSVHVDPTPSSSGATDTHHTYFQPGKVDNESQEDDYAQPDDPKEQNINHQVSVHVDPTPSSSGATDTQHTSYQPGKVDNESQEDDYAQPDDPKEQNIHHQVSVHVDPTPSSSEATDTQHTSFQPGKVDNESQEDDYAQPDDPKEQNINNQVSVHVDPTPSSSGAIDTQHTYFQPSEEDNESQEDDYVVSKI